MSGQCCSDTATGRRDIGLHTVTPIYPDAQTLTKQHSSILTGSILDDLWPPKKLVFSQKKKKKIQSLIQSGVNTCFIYCDFLRYDRSCENTVWYNTNSSPSQQNLLIFQLNQKLRELTEDSQEDSPQATETQPLQPTVSLSVTTLYYNQTYVTVSVIISTH